MFKQETQLARTKGIVDNLSASEVATTKRVDDLAEVILTLKKKNKKIKEELEKEIEKVRREVFLFEYKSNDDHKILSGVKMYTRILAKMRKYYDSRGVWVLSLYSLFDESRDYKFGDLFDVGYLDLFNLESGNIVDYKDFININQEYKLAVPDVPLKNVFFVKKAGTYIIDIRFYLKSDIKHAQYHI